MCGIVFVAESPVAATLYESNLYWIYKTMDSGNKSVSIAFQNRFFIYMNNLHFPNVFYDGI